jgi:hypothetical protein
VYVLQQAVQEKSGKLEHKKTLSGNALFHQETIFTGKCMDHLMQILLLNYM